VDLHRRKLWADRAVWVGVVATAVFLWFLWFDKGGRQRLYIFGGWCIFALLLLIVGELRVGRRSPDPGLLSFFADWAALVGEERTDPEGKRRVEWRGTVPGALEFAPAGVAWRPRGSRGDREPLLVEWPKLYAWRMSGVLPVVPRASGYVTLTLTDQTELVFHVNGLRRWRDALREAFIVGPTYVRPDWLPDEAGAELPLHLATTLEGAGGTATVFVGEITVPAYRRQPATGGKLSRKERRAAAARSAAAAPSGAEPGPAEDSATVPEAAVPEVAVPDASVPEAPAVPEALPSLDEVDAEPEAAAKSEPEAVAEPEVEAPMPPPAAEPPAVEAAVEYEPVIGLECHVELSTASKVFCGCPTAFGAEPNTQICPVCTGQPGSLPVINEKAVEYATRIALALGCEVHPESIFHRKNYFYPDMPKNYQISQYDEPLATGGYLEIEVDGEIKRVGVHRVHLEEDTGKTTHAGETGRIAEATYALVDFNRAGVPLVEIVSEPDIGSSEDARAYLAELRNLLRTIGVSDVRMEEGSLRCDANVSLRPAGATELGTKAEVKNMNSIRSVGRALDHEIERQTNLLHRGEQVAQETRHFDENTGRTSSLRTKEYAFDYRYFPDPDLVPLAPDTAWVESIRAALPEAPLQRRLRFQADLGLEPVDARTLTASKEGADAFEAAVRAYGGDAKAIARWYLGEVAAIANERGAEPHEVISPEHMAELQKLVDLGRVSISMAKGEVLRKVVEDGTHPQQVVEHGGLAQISDASELEGIIDEVIQSNADVVEQIRSGKDGAVNALVGQVMKRTRGQANPKVVKELLDARLARV
jgi:aspartyl-tRNA(Asn)/glutamyl-tRNA(Gln) amidotransferase subunit B